VIGRRVPSERPTTTTLAVEPMVNEGTYMVFTAEDEWTVKTLDGKLSAHYENTIIITEGEPEIITL